MPKRFTATEKWDKEWFMKLSPKHKCLWMFINDKCDQAGMWEINYMVASMYIGEKITEQDFNHFGSRVEKFGNKFWIVDHIDFQCGYLSEKSPAHKPIFKVLNKYNLLDRVLNRVSDTLQEKEKDKEIEEDKEKSEKPTFPKDTYPSKKDAFEEMKGDQIYMEECLRSLTYRGWTSANDLTVQILLRYFLHTKADIENTRKDMKRHFKNWLNVTQLKNLQEIK